MAVPAKNGQFPQVNADMNTFENNKTFKGSESSAILGLKERIMK